MRRRSSTAKPRDKRTLIPAFDPVELAKEIEEEANRNTKVPPFDPLSYARIVVERVSLALEEPPPSMKVTAAPQPLPESFATDDTAEVEDTEAVGREMYGSYLSSDFPEALVLAERVLELDPAHALAQLVAERCRERLAPRQLTLSPSSVLRLKLDELQRHAGHIDPTSSFVLGHVDGVSDAETIAVLSGLPRTQALDRLHALLDLGVLEVVA